MDEVERKVCTSSRATIPIVRPWNLGKLREHDGEVISVLLWFVHCLKNVCS